MWNDDDWFNYVNKVEGTLGGEVARAKDKPFESGKISSDVSSRAGSYSAGSGTSGPGILDSIGGGLGRVNAWFVNRLWPLAATKRLGQRLIDITWKAKLPGAVFGALMGSVLLVGVEGEAASWPWAQAVLVDVAGASALLVALGLGAVAGWFAIPTLGVLLVVIAVLVGLALALAVVALVLGMAYTAIGSMAGWPPFDESPPAIDASAPASVDP